MASMAAASIPDAIVTLKVSYDFTTRKCKLPLKDLGPFILESKLRSFLNITPDADCLFERYSDSAAAFVVLDHNNISVYKQLYRAAKAKSKLKIRVTDRSAAVGESTASKSGSKLVGTPKPVSIEDEPESAIFFPLGRKSSADTLVPTNHSVGHHLVSLFTEPVLPEPLTCPPPPTVSMNKLSTSSASCVGRIMTPFSIYCNSCDKTVPDSHYHCDTCDDGDFDLCPSCVKAGISCYGPGHWLIKRAMKDGIVINSTTENIKSKAQPKTQRDKAVFSARDATNNSGCSSTSPLTVSFNIPDKVSNGANGLVASDPEERTCNSCLRDFPDRNFLHCGTCPDYDLCVKCFAREVDGHHPNHAFAPLVPGFPLSTIVAAKLGSARGVMHNAICDACDVYIIGVRHRCLDCPDWDYCGECVKQSKLTHPDHRFVPIYEPLPDVLFRSIRPVHVGICCDGPLCSKDHRRSLYISGTRYKCAVCHDTDFCANCEATPGNTHNKTHPLIKFKTPVRHVSVTTHGESEDGQKLQSMGDRYIRTSVSSRATETTPKSRMEPSCNQVSMNSATTIVDVEPESEAETKYDHKSDHKSDLTEVGEDDKIAEFDAQATTVLEPQPIIECSAVDDFVADTCWATYVADKITDGTRFPPDYVFEQTWILRNTGLVDWPLDCAVKFVGGDYMGLLSTSRAARVSELLSASESSSCPLAMKPHEEFAFSVSLRTPIRPGVYTSYWRLTSKDGIKFGDRLWCEVMVEPHQPVEVAYTADMIKSLDAAKPVEVIEPAEPTHVTDGAVAEIVAKSTLTVSPSSAQTDSSLPQSLSSQSSQPQAVMDPQDMVFPQLEKESPEFIVHQTEERNEIAALADEFEDCGIEDDWEGSEDGFRTDEEYDILDASDEEIVANGQKKMCTH